MPTKIMEWVSIAALLLAVTWRPSSNYQIAVEFVVCTGAVMMVLALFSIQDRVETHYGVSTVDNRSDVRKRLR